MYISANEIRTFNQSLQQCPLMYQHEKSKAIQLLNSDFTHGEIVGIVSNLLFNSPFIKLLTQFKYIFLCSVFNFYL